jgi:hypothetical protein
MKNAHCGHLLSMGTPVLRFLQVTGGELDNPGAVYALHCLHRVRAGFWQVSHIPEVGTSAGGGGEVRNWEVLDEVPLTHLISFGPCSGWEGFSQYRWCPLHLTAQRPGALSGSLVTLPWSCVLYQDCVPYQHRPLQLPGPVSCVGHGFGAWWSGSLGGVRSFCPGISCFSMVLNGRHTVRFMA